jgi:ATP-dependent DNA helicase RecQ
MLLSGFGKAKAEKYGDEIIEMVETYCNQYGLESHIELKEANPKRQRKEPSKTKVEKIPSGMVSLQYYKQGKTINEIATERNMTVGTIEGHLSEFIKTGEIKINEFVEDAKAKIIAESFKNNPQKRPVEIKSMLGDDYSYSEIRAVANHLLWLSNK